MLNKQVEVTGWLLQIALRKESFALADVRSKSEHDVNVQDKCYSSFYNFLSQK